MPSKKSIQALITRINKQYGQNVIVLASEAKGLAYKRVSTGSFGLDIGTSGGFVYGRIHKVISKEFVGKTSLAYSVIASIHREIDDSYCAFVDAEDTYDPVMAERLGVDQTRLLLIKPDCLEQAGDVVQECLEAKLLLNVTIDSWQSLFPTEEYEKEMGDKIVGTNAMGKNKLMRKILAGIRADLTSDNPRCMVVILNHINFKIGVMFGSPETDSGGMAKNYLSSISIKLATMGSIDKTIRGIKRRVGKKIKWIVEKNKTGIPFMEGNYDVYTHPLSGKVFGIDRDQEILDYALKHKLIGKDLSLKDFVSNTINTRLKRLAVMQKIRRLELGVENTRTGSGAGFKKEPSKKHKARKKTFKKIGRKKSS